MSLRLRRKPAVNRGSQLTIHRDSKFSLKHSNMVALAFLGVASLSGLVTVGASALSIMH